MMDLILIQYKHIYPFRFIYIKISTIALGVSISLETIHCSRLIPELSLTNYKVPIWCNTAISRHLCTSHWSMTFTNGLLHLIHWEVECVNFPVRPLSDFVFSAVIDYNFLAKRQRTSVFLSSYTYSFHQSHWKNPTLFHATQTFLSVPYNGGNMHPF